MDFFVGLDRAMVSLGPLSASRFCSYACAFCYVRSHFSQYPTLGVGAILEWLRKHRASYSIVYVSGDTDSFAKPRTKNGLELLEALVELDCDVLFTTRALLEDAAVVRIRAVSENLRRRGRVLIGCVSISRLRSAPHLEPYPVPSPECRIDVLRSLRAAGVPTVLAMRPFLPVIPAAEYCELVGLCRGACDVVLGEAWYFDPGGALESAVLGPGVRVSEYTESRMDFADDGVVWRVWEPRSVVAAVEKCCERASVPFFMRSAAAVELIRARYSARECVHRV